MFQSSGHKWHVHRLRVNRKAETDLCKSVAGHYNPYNVLVNHVSLKTRSSHRRCSFKKAVVKNFWRFTGKHLCQSLFYNKVAGLKFLRTTFLHNTSLSEGFNDTACRFWRKYHSQFHSFLYQVLFILFKIY